MALVHLVGHLAGVADPAVVLGALAVGLAAAAAGPLHPVVAVGPGWPEVVAAAGVAAGLLSLLPAWPLLRVLALPRLVAWLLWLPLWLWRRWLSWLLLLLVRLLLLAVGVLSLCLSAIGFGPCT